MNINDFKSCPYCDEEVKTRAIKCRYCHSFLEEGKEYREKKEKTEDMNIAQELVNSLENIYYILKHNNSDRDEHWLLANTWLNKYGDTDPAKQKGFKFLIFIAYKDTLNFSVLHPPESIKGLALYLVYKELGEIYAKHYVEEFNPIMEKVMKYKNSNQFFTRYKKINHRTWEENQEKTSTPFSIYWLLNVFEKPPPEEKQLFHERFELKTCPYCQKDIPLKAIKCRHCDSLIEESYGSRRSPYNNTSNADKNKFDNRIQEINQVRPWVRYFARMTDYFLFAIVISVVTANTFPALFDFMLNFGILATPFVIFTWNFVEAFALSTYGTTPGKWLLNTYITDVRGNMLSFSAALSRSFQVFIEGLGLGIFPINIVTLIIACRKLTGSKFGKTPWDLKGGYRIRHKQIKPIRVVILILIWLGIVVLNV